jgi:tungstate transport system ATP-binding protein
VRGHERRERRDEALLRTGLAHLARQPARTLSAGEQQRLALARAWAVQPQIVLLDEPTSSLDPAATLTVEEIVGELHKSGCKVVMSTHDLGQASRLADEVLFLHHGQLKEWVAADTFFRSPASPEACDFLAGELSRTLPES